MMGLRNRASGSVLAQNSLSKLLGSINEFSHHLKGATSSYRFHARVGNFYIERAWRFRRFSIEFLHQSLRLFGIIIPVGDYACLAALNDDWTGNYVANAQLSEPNNSLSLGTSTNVKFYYDDKSHWVTDNVNSRIGVAPGNSRSELGCSGDSDPSCLRSWLQDVDGDGNYLFLTSGLLAGTYQTKAAINESWDENYGQSGIPGGDNITFTVPFDYALMRFAFDSKTNILTINADVSAVPEPASIALYGLGSAGLFLARRRNQA